MTALDWAIVAVYFAASASLGFYYTARAGRSTEEFFLAGRSLPWWLAGTSMVAATFSVDAPLAVTELVARNGIAGNWVWWNFAFGGLLTAFFFARLWRRSEFLTDVELIEHRYGDKPAAFLRGFRAFYGGVFVNVVLLALANLALASILEGMFEIPRQRGLVYVGAALAVAALYSALAGMKGVAVTSAFQFALALLGTTALAVVVLRLPQVGGLSGLQEKLPPWTFLLTPVIGKGWEGGEMAGVLALSLAGFLAYVGVLWWASGEPGAEPGGGGYVAQRMLSAKDERHSLLATLWFNLAHYCISPWPWILVGLAALVLYPQLGPDEKRLGYVWALRDHLPSGLRGLLVASFLAAYMSTVATRLNWGASYVVNDLYRRFLRSAAGERELVFMGRLMTLVLMTSSLLATLYFSSILMAWEFLMEAGAGVGLVLILRWFWWRINAWSEISATVAALVFHALVRYGLGVKFPGSLYLVVGLTTVVWLVTTYATAPVDRLTLLRFYRRVYPGGWGWGAIAQACPDVTPPTGLGRLFLDWLAGVALVYSALFTLGRTILGNWRGGLSFAGLAVASGLLLWWNLSRPDRLSPDLSPPDLPPRHLRG